MGQRETGGVEEHPAEAPGRARAAIEGEIAVLRVAHDGMPDGGEVPPDLVCAAGLDVQLEQGRLVVGRQARPMRDGLLQVDSALRAARGRLLVLGEAQIDRAAVALETSLREREIRFPRLAARERLG